jgi:hypothetical protein
MRKYLPHVLIISFVFVAIPITSATGGSKTLRSYYKDLSVAEVHSMSNISMRKTDKSGFYNSYSTIKHSYELISISGDKVVLDHTTGLMWHQNGSRDRMDWNVAKDWVRSLNNRGYAGYYDWRLPTVEEAASLLESSKRKGLYIDPVFSNVQWNIYTGDKKNSVDWDDPRMHALGDLSKALTSDSSTWYVSLRGGRTNTVGGNVCVGASLL